MKALKVRQFLRTQHLPLPPDEAFAFFERPENLASVTPDWLDFQLLTPSPVRMREGALIDYTIRQLGLRLRWRTLITDYQPPLAFTDEQLLGPYALWHHQHRFEAHKGGTRMIDEVHYALPNALPQWIADPLDRHFVQPRLEAIFSYRAARFDAIFAPTKDVSTATMNETRYA